ncbi:Ribosomal L.8/L5e family protein isoform 2 [Theobroma cacao]|uniref:Ribosomal L.8/L5e family protein isoform 2 n=1 Tax=Theobroma cacao TaxID=3641 RepID=A0A061F1Q8_THECC|nr:Ribosomal L.8/L5e family protein isoform 2 [Theobroma cacao]
MLDSKTFNMARMEGSKYGRDEKRTDERRHLHKLFVHLHLFDLVHCAPRSFFGVEDFLDDDNSRPYTYKKEKKSKNPSKHVSFKQRTVAYMEPFTLDVFISKRFVSASLTHRVTSKQVAVAGTNSKDIKAVLRSRSDIPACLAIGRILADRAREADVYTASYTPRERDKFEGKIRAVVQSLIDNGIDIKVYLD